MSELQPILKRISDRNHQIGIHPSYKSSVDPSLFEIEKTRLEAALLRAGVSRWSQTSRQHYLRWNTLNTWRNLDSIGIKVDSSLGFADKPGFRCGTSRTFSTFDWSNSQMLNLKEQPLLIMDATLTGKNYLALEWSTALQKIADLVSICKRYEAPMTILWHNDRFRTQLEQAQYIEVMRTIA